MSLIQITNLQPECQESRLGDWELRQIVGGYWMTTYVIGVASYDHPEFSPQVRDAFFDSDPAYRALANAFYQAADAGNVSKAKELDSIIQNLFHRSWWGQQSVIQVIGPG